MWGSRHGKRVLPAQPEAPGEKVEQRAGARHRRERLDALIAQLGKMSPHLWLQHLCHSLGELRRVTPGHQKTVFAVFRHESGPTPERVRGDHRAADAHRLGQYLREPVRV